jgi:F-type H+-transporting ATPase subunit alpha
VTELMKQKQYSPLSVAEMAVSLFAVDRGFLDDVPIEKIVDCEAALLAYMNTSGSDLLAKINETGDFNDDIEAAITKAVQDFKANNVW